MKRLLLTAALTLTACGGLQSEADEFRNASPSRQGVEIKVPDNGKALEAGDVASTQQALLGETAGCYTLTRGITVSVNVGTAAILKMVEEIVSYDPTTLGQDQAVWGPWTDALSPNTFKFTVNKVGANYDYALEAKGKSEDDAKYRKILFGHHEPGAAAKQGKGSFTLDWNLAGQLPEHGKEVGSADFTYERTAKLDVNIGVAFHQVKDDETGKLVDATYRFEQLAGGTGAFEFVLFKDIAGLPSNTAKVERHAVKSRWQNTGAGRCDIKFSEGDIVNPVTATECWGNTFLQTYYSDSLNITAPQGKETDCPFSAAEYTTL